MNFAVILSGGIGARLNFRGPPKQYLPVAGKPLLIHTLEKFQNNADTDAIVIVAAEEWRDKLRQWMREFRISRFLDFAPPGETRQESIFRGLEICQLHRESQRDLALIHDGVRPLVSDDLISRAYDAGKKYGGCMSVVPVADTIYQSEGGKRIERLLNRNALFAGQTPEVYDLTQYAEIHRSTPLEELRRYTGSSEIAFRHGMYVRLIPGEEQNFKITTFSDLERFRKLCEETSVVCPSDAKSPLADGFPCRALSKENPL